MRAAAPCPHPAWLLCGTLGAQAALYSPGPRQTEGAQQQPPPQSGLVQGSPGSSVCVLKAFQMFWES